MSREYETAPEIAMGTVPEYALDDTLYVTFTKGKVLDELLSYGSDPKVASTGACTISKKHPRYKELVEAERIEGDDPENRGMAIVSPTDRPHYRPAVMVKIMRRGIDPNDLNSSIIEAPLCEHKAHAPCPKGRECYRNRFAKQYEAWAAGKADELRGGFPLSDVPFLDEARRAELAHFHVFTAEQLIELPEDVSARFRGVEALKDKVRKFLAATKGELEEKKLDGKLAERDSQIAELRKQLSALQTQVAVSANAPAAAERPQARR